MTISAAYSLRNSLLLMILAVLLASCIQPDAPDPDAPPTVPAQTLPTAPVAATTAAPNVTAPPAPTINSAAARPTDRLPRVWRSVPIGPETIAIMFFADPGGARCVRYIFRAKVIPRCAAAGQTVVGVTGQEQAADGKTYTIIAGYVLDDRITVVSVEMQDGANMPAPVDDRGFILVLEGIHKATTLVPVDQFGNLVGGRVTL